MNFSLIKLITNITPRPLLPQGTKAIGGKNGTIHKPLNTRERREYLERNLTHKKDQFLDKHSPIRILKRSYKKIRLERRQKDFHSLIGQITLAHAGIEQDIKNTLICDWDVPEKFEEEFEEEGKKKRKEIIIETHFGEKLKKRFFKEIKCRLIPNEKLEEYKILYKEFWSLSEKRNQTLKAIYSFNQDTDEIHRVHQKNHMKYDRYKSYEEWLDTWMPKVNINTPQSLLDELTALRRKLLKLRSEIFTDKIKLHSNFYSKIGESHPVYASKNPYLYQEHLKNRRQT